MGRLVSTIGSGGGSGCHGNGRRSSHGNRGCGGSVGRRHGVGRHGSLVNGVTGYRGGMGVRQPGRRLLAVATMRGKCQEVKGKDQDVFLSVTFSVLEAINDRHLINLIYFNFHLSSKKPHKMQPFKHNIINGRKWSLN